jgi:hypothetical protein
MFADLLAVSENMSPHLLSQTAIPKSESNSERLSRLRRLAVGEIAASSRHLPS